MIVVSLLVSGILILYTRIKANELKKVSTGKILEVYSSETYKFIIKSNRLSIS